MESLSNAEAALLGLLSECPMYPYQIEKEVQQRDMRYWTELSMSSIYKLLRKLEKQNLVTSKIKISEDNRTRKIYKLAETGRTSLEEKIKVLLSEPEHIRWRMDIGISNLGILPVNEAVECLKKYRQKLKENISGYLKLEEYLKEHNCPDHRLGLAVRPVRLMEGELKWLENYIKEFHEPEKQK